MRYIVRLRILASIILIGGGGLLASTTYIVTQQRITKQANIKFGEITAAHLDELSHHLETYSNVLYATRALFASAEVNSAAWDGFIDNQALAQRYPGMQAAAYAEVVPRQDLTAYEKRMQGTYSSAFHVHPLKNQGDYVAITFHEETAPTPTHAGSLGLDIANDPARQDALGRAGRSNGIAATAPIRLATKQGTGFLLVSPVKNKRGFQTENTFGYSVAEFDIEDLIEASMGSRLIQYRTSTTITDVTDDKPITFYERDFKTTERTVANEVILDVADRKWLISFRAPTSSLLMITDRMAPTFVLLAGIGCVLLGCIAVYTLRLRYKLSCTLTTMDVSAGSVSTAPHAGNIETRK